MQSTQLDLVISNTVKVFVNEFKAELNTLRNTEIAEHYAFLRAWRYLKEALRGTNLDYNAFYENRVSTLLYENKKRILAEL